MIDRLDPLLQGMDEEDFLDSLGPKDHPPKPQATPISPLRALRLDPDLDDVAAALRQFVAQVNGADPLKRRVLREQAIQALNGRNISGAAGLVDAAMTPERVDPAGAGSAIAVPDAEPAAEAQDGAGLLDDLSRWIRRYLYLPAEAADAIAVWAVLTWLVDRVYHAPILAILSATKRCGKTVLLDLLRPLVHRGYQTSAVGVTTAVIFRLNERDHPTLLIDEGEKLAGREADRDLVGMLNVGYRRGAKVARCVERGGEITIADFDAFGFRAVAAIGQLWDTLLDRSIIVRLERAPRGSVSRFVDSQVTATGTLLAGRIRRWVEDHTEALLAASEIAPRPDWLDDRACDNWAGPFAIAAVAGDGWPERMARAAKALQGSAEDELDLGERLIHDLWQAFEATGWPQVIVSGDLVRSLVEQEAAPWGEYRGKGLTPHGLAHLLKRFKVGPRKDRNAGGTSVRGWWLADLQPVFARYPRPGIVAEEVVEEPGSYEADEREGMRVG